MHAMLAVAPLELTAALHHSAFKGAGPETHDAPRSQKTVNSKREAELFSLFEEELGYAA